MSYDSLTSDSSARPWTGRLGFPHLLTATLGLVAATILLGVAAKATGSGLACDANWPLCDGGLLNLFPANFPSFFEWIHRVVAMVAGISMITTAIVAWQSATVSRAITAAVVLGTVLTPVQVYLGRETVRQYEILILSLHFWTAIAIFVLFVVAAVIVWAPRLQRRHVTVALGIGATTLPVHVVLSPLFIGSYTPVIQTAQYGVTLTLLAAVILATMIGFHELDAPKVAPVLAFAPVLTVLVVLLGRRSVMTYAPALDVLYLAVTGALFAALFVGVWLTRSGSVVDRVGGKVE